jgi:sialate O-acetylesterase
MEMTIAGTNTITLKNILVGEVWLCSGQSNMAWCVSGANNAAEEVAKADHPTIRLFNVTPTRSMTDKPMDNLKAKWEVCTPKTVNDFSAVGYFFGRHIMNEMKVPVGLINAPWGGSPVERWIPMTAFRSDPELAAVATEIDKAIVDFPQALEKSVKSVETWKATTQEVVATRPAAATQPKGLPRAPQLPIHPLLEYGGMYNGMIAPLTNYAIKGAIWYQGEANAGDGIRYRTTFPAMIRGWRSAWGQGDFPFLYVQLANLGHSNGPNYNGGWGVLREAQTMTLSTPNTAMAVTIDVGDPDDIHPRDKQTVGYRLGLGAQAVAYGMKDVVYSGPMFDSMTIEGSSIRVHFKHADGGLVAGGDKLTGFAIAAEPHKYVWADAVIEGDTVVVSAKQVSKPIMVRYGWDNSPNCNLRNKSGLPAIPFRAGEPELTKK